MKSWRRRIRFLALALVLAAGVIALVVHTPPVRRLVLRYAIADVQRRYGIRIDAARLDYNLASLSVGLAQIRMAAERSPNLPFFEADYVRASLPRRALMGSVAFDEIAVTNGRVHVVRDRDGGTNLPEPSKSPGGEPAALDIARLVAPRLAVDLQDAHNDLALGIPGIDVDIGRAGGRISLLAPAVLSMGAGRRTRVSTLEGSAAFDGRALKLSAVQLRADEGSAQIDGALSLLVREPSVDLHATGTADVERLARWGIKSGLPDAASAEAGELPRGALAFDAHAMGALAAPVTEIHITSPRVTWSSGADLRASSGADLRPLDDARGRPEPVEGQGPRLVVTDVAATSRVTMTSADVRQLRFVLAGGRVEGKALIPFDDSAAHLHATWNGIDAASLTTALAGTVDIAPSGTLSGNLEAAGPLAQLSQWSADVRLHGDGGTTRHGRLAVPGDTRLQLADGRWRIEGHHRVGDVAPIAVVAAGRLDDAAPGNSTLSGTLVVSETDVPAFIRLLRVTGIASTSDDLLTGGMIAANVKLAGRLASPEIDADLQAHDLAGARLRAAAIDGKVSGEPLRSRLTISIRAPGATIGGQPLHDVVATGRLDGNVVRFDTLSAAQEEGAGTLSAAGTYDLRAARYDVTLDVARWNVAASPDLPLSGQVEAMFRGAGSASEPRGSGSLRVTRASWSGTSLGDLTADVRLDGQAANVTARAADFNATLTARTIVDAPYATTADVHVDDVDLGTLTAGSSPPVPVTGRATLVAHAEGPIQMWRDGLASVDVASLDAKAGDLPIRLAEPARLRYERQRVRVEKLEVDAGATRLSVSGELPASGRIANTSGADLPGPRNESGLVLAITGDIGEAARAVAATGLAQVPIMQGSGPLSLLARVTGSIENPIVAADLEAGPGSVTIKDLSTASDLTVRAHLEHDTLDLREAHASYEGAMLNATGSVPVSLLTSAPTPSTAPASLHATATGITPAVLRGILDPGALEDISGAVDVALNVQTPSLDLARATGDLTLTRLDLRLAGLSVTQRAPTRIVAQDGFARIQSWNWAGEGATVGVAGQVRLADRQAAILANGDIDLRVLTPFVRGAGIATGGRLTPRLSVTGPIDSPRIDGDVALDSGEIRLLDPRIIVNGLTGRAILTRTTATLAALDGSINGGSLTGSGSIEYQPEVRLKPDTTGTTTGGTIAATFAADIRDMALEFPAGLRSELNAMLQLDVASAPGQATPGGRLSGTVTVLRGAYREPLAVVGGLLSAMRARGVAATAGAESSAVLNQLALDIRVQTDEDLIVDNNVARAQLGADLRVIGTALAPTVAGRAEIREGGQLFVGRNVYRVESGVLDFANPTTIDPDVRIQASTRAGGEDIEVAISGSATQPSVELSAPSADPPLGQADITALLLTGKTLDQLNQADAAYIGAQVLGNLSGDVLGFAGRAVGLDTLRLGGVDDTGTRSDPTDIATAVDPTSRLTFGKSLGPDVDVTFSQSLRDAAAQTWIVEYLPSRQVDLRVVSGDTDLRSYAFRHDVSFGGGGTTAARAPGAARRTDTRVAEVSITGQPAFPEERIRAVLKLRPGGTFDFGRWQDDRDRLEAFYHQNGHLAARVNASRATDGDVVKLSYVLDAGPRTSIAVSGVELDRSVMQRLADAWAASIFDEFLVDEATQIVKSALAQRGYLQPMVTARVITEGGMKTLRIDVQPGNHSTDTRIRIQGPGSAPSHVALDDALAKDLDARINERRLIDQVIRDPGAVVRDLTDYLRSRGYLRAKVSAGAPRFEDDVAILPITVDPGPAFVVGIVAFEGRQGVPSEDLADAAAVMPGTPYDPAAIDAARDRLVALYRRHGFASATVTPRATIRPAEPRVDISFAIQEGARQTIGDIVVSGNSGVNADVIARAMRLAVGAPLEPDELLRARTRVFDTGLFRRVDVTTEAMGRTSAGDSAQPMRVRVDVDAWPALRLRYGFQATEEHPDTDPTGRRIAPGLSADITRRTLFGRAVSLGGAVQYQRRQSSQRALLNAPTLMSLPVQSSLVLERVHQQSAVSTFVTDRNSVSWEQRLRTTSRLTLSYAYRFERNHTFDTRPDAGSGLDFDIRINIARLIGTAAWDTRNDPLDAARGTLLSSSLQWAPDRLGSQFRFVKYVGQAYRFQQVGGVVLASAGRLGLVRALGGQELYVGERFFAGGSRTVRGVDEESLGERNVFGDPAGGEAMLVLNQEARVPMYKWLRGVAFIDAGNVFPDASALRFNALTGSIGFGVRLTTPFALLRADYGRMVWGAGPRSGRWIFGIGQVF